MDAKAVLRWLLRIVLVGAGAFVLVLLFDAVASAVSLTQPLTSVTSTAAKAAASAAQPATSTTSAVTERALK